MTAPLEHLTSPPPKNDDVDFSPRQSRSIAHLAEALAAAQAEMKGAVKDAKNPFFKSTYADLASCWDAARGPLTKNGLSIIQLPSTYEVGDGSNPSVIVDIETILAHASGEFIRSNLTARARENSHQAIGSCITYLRRYALQSVVGIAPEDGDGNLASGKPGLPAQVYQQQHSPQPPRGATHGQQQPPSSTASPNYQQPTAAARLAQKGLDLAEAVQNAIAPVLAPPATAGSSSIIFTATDTAHLAMARKFIQGKNDVTMTSELFQKFVVELNGRPLSREGMETAYHKLVSES